MKLAAIPTTSPLRLLAASVLSLCFQLGCQVEPTNESTDNLSIATSSTPRIRVVDPIGNDDNPGTPAKPWKTLFKASEAAVAGDTVIVRAGVYHQWLRLWNSGNQNDGAIVFRSEKPGAAILDGMVDMAKAAAGDWIKVDGLPGTDGLPMDNLWKRKLRDRNFAEAYCDGQRMPSPIAELSKGIEDLDNGMSYVKRDAKMLYVRLETAGDHPNSHAWQLSAATGIQLYQKHGIVIEGFEVRNFGDQGISVNGSQTVDVNKNVVHHNGRAGIIVSQTDRVLVRNNDVYANGKGMGWASGVSVLHATGHDILVTGNVSHHNWDNSDQRSDGNGFILDNPITAEGGATFINNVAYANGGSGFRITASPHFGPVYGNHGTFINNTSIANGQQHKGEQQVGPGEMSISHYTGEPLTDIVIVNNIFAALPGKAAFRIHQSAAPADSWHLDHNLYYSGEGVSEVVYLDHLADFVTLNEVRHEYPAFAANSLVDDPRFVADDYHLTAESPAIDRGLDHAEVVVDIDGDDRPQLRQTDMGADEFLPSAAGKP